MSRNPHPSLGGLHNLVENVGIQNVSGICHTCFVSGDTSRKFKHDPNLPTDCKVGLAHQVTCGKQLLASVLLDYGHTGMAQCLVARGGIHVWHMPHFTAMYEKSWYTLFGKIQYLSNIFPNMCGSHTILVCCDEGTHTHTIPKWPVRGTQISRAQ